MFMQGTINKSRLMRLFAVLLMFGVSTVWAAEERVFKSIGIQVKNIDLKVEYADTFELRNRGLMHRKSLCQQCGMLFNFGQQRHAGMWMKNTFIPLDVAFITKDGVITDIKAMKPHDLTSIGSSVPVHYALEMNQGWFAENQIVVGDKVLIK